MLSVLRVGSRAGVASLEEARDGGDRVSRAQTALCIGFSRKKKNGVGSGAAKKWEENQASASNPVTSEAPTPPSDVGTAARKGRRVMKWGEGSVCVGGGGVMWLGEEEQEASTRASAALT